VQIPAPGGALDGYLAAPVSGGPAPGVVVIHDAFGMAPDTRAWTDRFAAAGFVGLAPDLFSTGPTPLCVMGAFRSMLRGKGRAVEQIDAARAFLAGNESCTGRVGIIGFCMGGGFALVAATRGFDASAPAYGQLPLRAQKALAGSCPIVGSYGKKDPTLRGAAAKLERTLAGLGVAHDVKEYPDVGHSFMNDHAGWRGTTVERLPGFGYDEAASDDAFARVTAFFGTHLSAAG
jgi:carboxymethylenebutenolidase